MHSPHWQYGWIGVALCALAGCTEPLAPCSGPVTVKATSSLSPTLSWAPNCRIDQVVIEELLPPSVGGSHALWVIDARTPGEGAAGPIRYGQVPASMQESIPAEPLAMGHSYRIRVSAGGAAIGEMPFVYWAPD